MGKNLSKVTTTFQFCDGGSCQKANSEIAVREARAYLRNQGLWDSTHTIKTRCNGRCENAPTCIVQPGNYWYKELTPEKAVAVVASHVEQQQPVEDYLLYREGWSDMVTDQERTLALPVFKLQTEAPHGEVLVARAFASDQHLYPLFQYLFTAPRPIAVQLDEGVDLLPITEPHQVLYTDTYQATITGPNLDTQLTIAGIPKDIDAAIADRKVSVAEVIWLRKSTIFTKAIRLKNKKGKHLMTCWIRETDTTTWEHVLRIYLSMEPTALRIQDAESIKL